MSAQLFIAINWARNMKQIIQYILASMTVSLAGQKLLNIILMLIYFCGIFSLCPAEMIVCGFGRYKCLLPGMIKKICFYDVFIQRWRDIRNYTKIRLFLNHSLVFNTTQHYADLTSYFLELINSSFDKFSLGKSFFLVINCWDVANLLDKSIMENI